jgi:predicted O-methyltransferase YrrM
MKLYSLKLKLKLVLFYPKTFFLFGLNGAYEEHMKKYFLGKYKILRLPSIDIMDLLKQNEQVLNTYSFLPGTSLITDLLLLKSLANNIPDCTYLEIGSWRGESIVNIAEVADECFSVTLSKQEMKKNGFDQSVIDNIGFFIADNRYVKIIEENSHTYDFTRLNKKFDLIFIDGDHSYKGVLNDTRKVFPLLKDDNSVIVWHDHGFTVEDVRYSVLSAIFDGLPVSEHKYVHHVSNTLCAVYTKSKYATRMITPNEKPNKIFSLNLKINRI